MNCNKRYYGGNHFTVCIPPSNYEMNFFSLFQRHYREEQALRRPGPDPHDG